MGRDGTRTGAPGSWTCVHFLSGVELTGLLQGLALGAWTPPSWPIPSIIARENLHG
jgi:hypothetical protein